jgi:hypothetical protein
MGGPGGMPNLRAISGKPLPDRGMPAGTVTVRVGRKSPANAVADLEITAIIKNSGGDLRKRTAKTDTSGRAIFEGIAADQEFQAEAVVDGERLKTDSFPMPAEGGVRMMLISGLGPAGADEAAGAGAGAGAPMGAGPAGGGEGNFTLGVTSGSAKPDTALPTGTLVLQLSDEDGKPIANFPVIVGAVDKSNQIKVHRGTSDGRRLWLCRCHRSPRHAPVHRTVRDAGQRRGPRQHPRSGPQQRSLGHHHRPGRARDPADAKRQPAVHGDPPAGESL